MIKYGIRGRTFIICYFNERTNIHFMSAMRIMYRDENDFLINGKLFEWHPSYVLYHLHFHSFNQMAHSYVRIVFMMSISVYRVLFHYYWLVYKIFFINRCI